MAVPAVQTTSTGTAAAAGSVTVTKPSGTASGDLLVAFITTAASGSISTPSGWTTAGSVVDGFTAVRTQGFYKVAGGSEPSDYTFSRSSGTSNIAGGIARITGHDGTTQIDATPTTASQTTGSSPASPSITTVTDDCLILRVCGTDIATTAIPASHTDVWTIAATSAHQRLATTTQPTAGSTGTANFTISSSNQATLITIAIRPAAASGSVGASAGVGSASGVGASLATSAGSSAGVASASGVALSLAASSATANGIATASAVGTSTEGTNSTGASAGIATASGVGASLTSAVGPSSGIAVASAVGASLAASVGMASGVATASALSDGAADPGTGPTYFTVNATPLSSDSDTPAIFAIDVRPLADADTPAIFTISVQPLADTDTPAIFAINLEPL